MKALCAGDFPTRDAGMLGDSAAASSPGPTVRFRQSERRREPVVLGPQRAKDEKPSKSGKPFRFIRKRFPYDEVDD